MKRRNKQEWKEGTNKNRKEKIRMEIRNKQEWKEGTNKNGKKEQTRMERRNK